MIIAMEVKNKCNKRFKDLVRDFHSCVFSMNSSGSPRVQDIVQIQTLCSLKDAILILECCPKLKKLTSVSLNYCINVPSQLQTLAKYPFLEQIGIHDIRRKLSINEPISKVSQLKINSGDRQHMNHIKTAFPNLLKLTIIGMVFSLQELQSQKQCKLLKALFLCKVYIVSPIFDSLSDCIPKLEQLSIDNCTFRESNNYQIDLKNSLQHVSVSFSHFSQATLGLIKSLSQKQIPTSIRIDFMSMKQDKALPVIEAIQKYPLLLEKLVFHFCNMQATQAMKIFHTSPHSIAHIQLQSCKMNSQLLKELVNIQSNIKVLNLKFCDNLGNQLIIEISRLNLTELRLTNILKNKDLIYVRRMKNLQVIELNFYSSSEIVFINALCNLKKIWKTLTVYDRQSKKMKQNIRQVQSFI